jgi:gamma-glutamyltranspeptidase / glutathione hydrolase
MNLNSYPYPSRRNVVVGKRGAVATSQPQAALAGMEMMLAGGNAVDAIVAMATALTVLEPTSNGIGSDAFALVHDGQKLHGLNAHGDSPAGLDFRAFAAGGKVPTKGWLPVTVPGAPSAWRALHDKFGKLPFEKVFEPAIRYAEEGFAVTPETGRNWVRSETAYSAMQEACHQHFKTVFLPGGKAPRPAEIFRSPWHAATLREIAQTGTDSFYRGNLAAKMADFAAATNGFITREDLAAHQAEWVEPISMRYRGLELHEIPPSGQGIVALMALKMLEGFDVTRFPRDSVEAFHLQIEATKLAFADAQKYVADPRHMTVSTADLLNPKYLADRAKLIGDTALPIQAGAPKGGTVYLCAADGELQVSFIQSNYMGFGSGIVVDGTGISLQNRGACFVLDEGHANQYAPGKKPFHTIIPGFITREGKPLGPMGVMGGHMQPQGHLQVITHLEDYGLNPQAALDAPRWQWVAGKQVELEPSVPAHIVQGLRERGHEIIIQPEWGSFGRGQMILKPNEAFLAATEPRTDGMALGW